MKPLLWRTLKRFVIKVINQYWKWQVVRIIVFRDQFATKKRHMLDGRIPIRTICILLLETGENNRFIGLNRFVQVFV